MGRDGCKEKCELKLMCRSQLFGSDSRSRRFYSSCESYRRMIASIEADSLHRTAGSYARSSMVETPNFSSVQLK